MSSNFVNRREWMYRYRKPKMDEITKEFERLIEFMRFATLNGFGKIICPCIQCNNRKHRDVNKVWNHLFKDGFRPNNLYDFSMGKI